MSKKIRHEAIKTIVRAKEINTQEEMVKALIAEGFKVTQTTVSRDIKELGLSKLSSSEGSFYILPEEKNDESLLKTIFKRTVLKIQQVEFFLVIHTSPGGANTVAFHLDESKRPELVGTIAGDDTLLVILQNKNLGPVIAREFQSYL